MFTWQSQDQTVTATFGPPKGTAITKATINGRKKKASFTFGAPGAITGFECKLIRPKPKHHKGGKKRSRAGTRKKPKFALCVSAKLYKHLAPDHYTFKVRALDVLGADAVPATKSFKVSWSNTRSITSKNTRNTRTMSIRAPL